MYLRPFLQLVSSTPILTSPSKREGAAASSRASTLLHTGPTLFQPMRMSSAVALREQLAASHATCSSKARVKREPGSAHGTEAVTTPCSGHATRSVGHST